jgi:hypothetical protein
MSEPGFWKIFDPGASRCSMKMEVPIELVDLVYAIIAAARRGHPFVAKIDPLQQIVEIEDTSKQQMR